MGVLSIQIYKDSPDGRDYVYQPSGKPIPPITDLREYAIDVEDQEATGSCTAQAGTSALEMLANRLYGRKVELSRLFLYYTTREIANRQITDNGASIRDLCKAMQQGVCDEDVWPFVPFLVNIKPNETAYKKAKDLKVGIYARCPDIRAAVADGVPVIIGARVRERLKTLSGPMDTHLEQLKDYPTTPITGGHAMLVVGYDDHDASYIVANSWGTQWGDKGYFKIDRGQIHADMMDAWVVTDVKYDPTVEVVPAPVPEPTPEPSPIPAPEPKPLPTPDLPPTPEPKNVTEESDKIPAAIVIVVLVVAIATKIFGVW